jgi:ankyrin repeat protein
MRVTFATLCFLFSIPVCTSSYGVAFKSRLYRPQHRGILSWVMATHEEALKRVALVKAIGEGDVFLVRKLARQGADLNRLDSAGMLPLSYAIRLKDLSMVRELLALGARVDLSDNFGTPLHYAVLRNAPEIIAELLAHGASAAARDKNGKLPEDLTEDPEIKRLLQSSYEGPDKIS